MLGAIMGNIRDIKGVATNNFRWYLRQVMSYFGSERVNVRETCEVATEWFWCWNGGCLLNKTDIIFKLIIRSYFSINK